MKVRLWVVVITIFVAVAAAAAFLLSRQISRSNSTDLSTRKFPVQLPLLAEPAAFEILDINGSRKMEGCSNLVIAYDQLVQGQNYRDNGKDEFVEKNLFVVIQGWAYDPVSNKPASEIYVDLGYKSYPVEYGLPRKDRKSGRPGNTGFKCSIPLSDLFFTPKRLRFKVINAGRTGYYLSDAYSMTVLKRKLLNMNGIGQNPNKTRHIIDEIQGESFSEQTIYTNYRTSFLSIAGWAVDDYSGGPAGGFYIAVDQTNFFPAAYGFERLDVAKAFDNYQFLFSGFEASIPIDKIGDGMHQLDFWVVNLKFDVCHHSELRGQLYITNTNVPAAETPPVNPTNATNHP